MRQGSLAAYLAELERLRGRGLAVGVAPHSVRACPRDWLEELGRYAAAQALPLHVHAGEQPREIEECVAEHGLRPIELLAESGASVSGRQSSTRRTPTAPSSTCSATAAPRICACPTTEADLGDGFLPAVRVRHRRIPLCIGSDSNVRIDPFEELRELEGIARRQDGRRDVFSTEELWEIGGTNGGVALGLEAWEALEVDPTHRSLEGVAEEHVRAALIAGCGAEVVTSSAA